MPEWLKQLLGYFVAPFSSTVAVSKGTDIFNGDFWSDTWNSLEDYNEQADRVNQATAATGDPMQVAGFVEHLAGPAVGIDSNLDNTGSVDQVPTAVDEALQGSPSIAGYMKENPDLSPEDYLQWMASQSDEWAEKWIDYAIEKQSIDEANKYTASREDTAYQRLVRDLKQAGLNPAMLYGSSASTSASGSAGVVNMASGANSRSISNYDKIKQLLLAYMLYGLKAFNTSTNAISKGLEGILSMLH